MQKLDETVGQGNQMSREQMIAWLTLEGWEPWRGDYEGPPNYGARRGESDDEHLTEKELRVGWGEVPDDQLKKLYVGASGGRCKRVGCI